jgi:response regulator RpfG family c-di-GMP phosphodiesterase
MKILVIDDSQPMRSVMKATLAGNDVLESGTLAAGLAIAAAVHPSIIFADLILPDQSAAAVASGMQRLKEAAPEAVIFAIGGVANSDVVAVALASGADKFISKESNLVPCIMDSVDAACRKLGIDKVISIAKQVRLEESPRRISKPL